MEPYKIKVDARNFSDVRPQVMSDKNSHRPTTKKVMGWNYIQHRLSNMTTSVCGKKMAPVITAQCIARSLVKAG